MTTIAYKDGVLAGDSQISRDGMGFTGVSKVFATNRHVIGIAGPAPLINSVLNWITEVETLAEEAVADREDAEVCIEMFRDLLAPEFRAVDSAEEDLEILVVHQSSRACYLLDYLGNTISLGEDVDVAIGSGKAFALGAMAMGAGAERAVEIAARYDTETGGKIVTIPL